MGDEVPCPRWPALHPLICPVGSNSWHLRPYYQRNYVMDKNLHHLGLRVMVDQTIETPLSGRCKIKKTGAHSPHVTSKNKKTKWPSRSDGMPSNPAGGMGTLLLIDLFASFSHGSIHFIFKRFGAVLQIRLTYDSDFWSNQCYITFNTSVAAKVVFEAKDSQSMGNVHSTLQLMRSINVADWDNGHWPNIFDDSKKHCIPIPYWFTTKRDMVTSYMLLGIYKKICGL